MKRILFLALACGAAFTGFTQAKLVETVTAKPGEIVIPYQKYILPNGLTVILTEDHSDPLVHVDVTYHVGSAREEIGKSGFAHFFEHMMFEGSDHVANREHFKIISGSGGTMNGSTTLDRTNYYETVPSNQLEKMLWLESDRMGFLLDAVSQEKFEIQRSTVKNERGQNYDNRPYGLTSEFTSKNLYPYGHPYSWLTIGYIEDLNRGNVNDLKNFFLRWYGPNNATLTIGGDLKPAETIKWIEKYFGNIPRGPEVTKTVLAPVVIASDRYASYTDNYAKLPVLSKTFATVPNYHKDQAALTCLAQVLGRGKNSVLYQQLVKPLKVLNAGANSRLSELAGEFTFTVTPLPGQSLGKTDTLLQEALASFEKRGVTDDDIAKYKGGVESQYINTLQSVSGKVSQLATFQTFAGNPNMIKTQYAKSLAVTKEDVMNAYNTYIKGKHSVTVSVLVKGQTLTPAMPDNYTVDASNYTKPNYGYEGLKYVKATDNFDRKKQPPSGANPVVKVPPYTIKSWSNGIKQIVAESHELPIVNMTIYIPGGRLAESNDPSKQGLAAITAAMLNEDTKKYTAEEMAIELEKKGSSIGVGSSLDGMVYSVQYLPKNLSATMSLLEERMLHPNFTEEAFSRIKKQTLEGLKQAKAQPATIADRVYDRINFGNSILGTNSTGTEATVKNITLKDVQDFYAANLSTNGVRIVAVGDVKPKELESALSFLNKLPNKTIEYSKPAFAAPVSKTVLYLVDVPKAAQTEFRVGMPTNLVYDATGEYYRAGLMNFPLGSSPNGRLHLRLRQDKGWTYDARSQFSANEYGGTYTFSSGIRADATDSALTELMLQVKDYAANGITDDELAFMKSAIGQRDARAYETGVQKAAFVGRILQYNLPANYVEKQNTILKNMTTAEANALAKKWLDTNKMNILLVGDKAKILPGLQKLGYEIVELDADGNRK